VLERAVTRCDGRGEICDNGQNFNEPPPELVEGEEVYEVETILKHRKRGRGWQYFVKWRGYPISDASWEPEHVFSDDGDMLT
jgi:hypothetical protein